MNIGLKFRDLFGGSKLGVAVLDELDNLVSGIVAHWQVDHNDDGTHGDLDADSVTAGTVTCDALEVDALTGYLKGTAGVVSAQATPIPTADLGSGVADATTFLRGDQTWVAVSGGAGEVNTASNIGTAGVGLYDSKSGADLRFRKINAGSNKVSVTLDGPNTEVDLDVTEANLTLNNLGGTLGLAKGGTNADLSASGPGFLKQSSGGAAVTVEGLSSGDLPSHQHAASDIASGELSKARGGTGADLSAETIWHSGNDGTGTGLDADLVDGQHASAFASSGHTHDAAYAPIGATYIVQTASTPLTNEQALGALDTGLLKNTTTTGVLSIASAGVDYAAATHAHAAGDITSGQLSKARGGTGADLTAETIWHSGNDGTGSLLDADRLDGNEATYFATSGHNHDGTYVPVGRTVSTSTGLTGGGDLSANRTLSVVDNSTTQKVEVAAAGTLIGTRKKVNFIQSGGVTVSASDDVANDRVNVTISTDTNVGEANTASNYGVGGVAVYDSKNGVDLRFRSINAASSKVTVAHDATNHEVDIDVADNTSTQKIEVAAAGSTIGTRKKLNFIQSGAIAITVADNSGSDRVDVTIDTPTNVGEANTASNYGTGGVAVYDSKNGVDLRFRSINAGSNKVSVTHDSGNHEVDVDVVEANLTLGNLGGSLSLDNLSDVTITSAASGDFIRHSGTAWVDSTIQAADLPSHTHAAGDVTSGQLAKARGGTGADLSAETIWHSGNDGTGSLLDADKLDGNEASAFSLSGHTHDATYAPIGAKYLVQTADAALTNEQALSTLTTGLMKVTNGTGVVSTALAGSDYAAASHAHAASDITSGQLDKARGGTGADLSANTIWHSGNDGTTSGLDADLLDGQHAAAFAAASHTHDGRYFTETESDGRFAPLSHNHDHNALTNYDANKHVDHTAVSISAGSGLTGGGTLAANRTLALDVAGLTADATPDGTADYVPTYDTSAAGHKKALIQNLPVAYASVTGKPSTFAPSAHTHSTSDVTSGTFSLARGGNGADLTGQGGAGKVVKLGAGATAFTAATLTTSDLGTGTANSGTYLRGDLAWKSTERLYNVRDYGAVGNYTNDDTSAIQAAIDAAEAAGMGTVFIPEGDYKITAGLTVTSGRISILGAGLGVTILFPTITSGDLFYIAPTGANPPLQRISLLDFSVYSDNDSTSGALVHFYKCNHLLMRGVELNGYYGGLHLESCVYGHFESCVIRTDQNFPAYRQNSYLVRINKATDEALPSELHFNTMDLRGSQGNNYLDYAWFLQHVDGCFVSNIHTGFAKHAGIAIVPDSATAQVTAVNFTNCYVDTCQEFGILVEEPANYTGLQGGHMFANLSVFNCETGLAWNCLTQAPSSISNLLCWKHTHHGITIEKGALLTFDGGRIWDVNKVGDVYAGVHLGAGADRISLQGLTIEKGVRQTDSAAYAGLILESGATRTRVTNCVFDAVTYPLLDAATDSQKWFKDNQVIGGSMYTVPTENPDGNGLMRAFSVFDIVKVGTMNNLDSIDGPSSWTGRKLTLVFTGAITVSEDTGTNFKLSGPFNTTSANDTLTLLYDGTNWLEMGRSQNTN